MFENIDADTLAVRMAAWKTVVLDVRDPSSSGNGSIPDALRVPLSELCGGLRGLPLETSLSLVCQTGEQAVIAAKLLWALGYRRLAVLRDGFAGYVQRGLPVSI